MGTFGSLPTDFVEVPDPDDDGQPRRPDAGTPLLYRDPITHTALDPSATLDLGYVSDVITGYDLVEVSADGGTSWRLLISKEGLTAAVGALATQAAAVAAAASASTAATAASLSSASAVTSAATAQQIADSVAEITVGPQGPAGDNGAAGAPGATPVRMEFPDRPAKLDWSDPYPLTYDAVLGKKLTMTLREPNATATTYELSLFQDRVDLLTPLGKTLKCSTGESVDYVTLDSPLALTLAGGVPSTLEWRILNKGADGAGTATVPVVRNYVVYASGVGGAPVTLNNVLSFSASLTLPTYEVGDELRISIQSNITPTGITTSTGTWVQVGSPVVDTNSFAVQTTWRKTAVTSESNPTVVFSGNAGMAAIIASYYTVDGAAPIDGTPATAVQNTSNANGTTAALPATTSAQVLGVVTVGTRFASSGAPTSLVSAPGDASLTKVGEALTARGSTSPNFGITLFSASLPTLGTAIPAKTVPLTTTTGTPAPVAWWYMRSTGIKGGAADNPGTRPTVDCFITFSGDNA